MTQGHSVHAVVGIKTHIGVDEVIGLINGVMTTAADVGNVNQADDLLNGKEKVVFGDAGHLGAEKHAPTRRGRKCYAAARRSKVRTIEDETLRALTAQTEHIKATIRAAVEHTFRVIKCPYGHSVARYCGLDKNSAQVLTLFASSIV